jgi:hypothetical protein
VTQPPVRYENYPPDGSTTPAGSTDENTPVVRPYLPATIPPTPPSDGSTRRTVLGLVIGIPLVGLLFSAVGFNGNRSGPDPTFGQDPGVNYPDMNGPNPENADPTQMSIGPYYASVPAGWTSIDDGSGTTAEVTNGANRLTAVSIETATSSIAVEDIARQSSGLYPGFTGKISDPVDRSSANLQHATMDGTGRYQGKAARLMVELWIDDNGSGLVVARVLTAKVSSRISTEAQEMLEELSGNF